MLPFIAPHSTKPARPCFGSVIGDVLRVPTCEKVRYAASTGRQQAARRLLLCVQAMYVIACHASRAMHSNIQTNPVTCFAPIAAWTAGDAKVVPTLARVRGCPPTQPSHRLPCPLTLLHMSRADVSGRRGHRPVRPARGPAAGAVLPRPRPAAAPRRALPAAAAVLRTDRRHGCALLRRQVGEGIDPATYPPTQPAPPHQPLTRRWALPLTGAQPGVLRPDRRGGGRRCGQWRGWRRGRRRRRRCGRQRGGRLRGSRPRPCRGRLPALLPVSGVGLRAPALPDGE